MIAIKGMEEMPNACTSTQEILGDIAVANCPLYNICKHRDTIRTNYKPSDCPLVEIEERKVGKWEYKQLGFRKYGLICTSCGYAIQLGYDFTSMKEFKDMVERKLQGHHITMDKFCCKCGSRNERL